MRCCLQVLTPVQAAVLHIRAGRDLCEPLSFCNLVALDRGETFMPVPPISETISGSVHPDTCFMTQGEVSSASPGAGPSAGP